MCGKYLYVYTYCSLGNRYTYRENGKYGYIYLESRDGIFIPIYEINGEHILGINILCENLLYIIIYTMLHINLFMDI